MFENILGHESLRHTLQHDISNGRLPGAILLNGPRYGGKSSVALEIARVVSCHETGKWNCACHSCRLHRTLEHPRTVMVGPRYFSLEVRAALEAFRREQRPGTAYLLVRSVRKLVRRFDAHLWNETKLKKALPIAEKVEDAIREIEDELGRMDGAPEGFAGDASRWDNVCSEIEKHVPNLERALPYDPAPVDLIRALSSWARIASDTYRVAIIEDAHTLQEAARNAMLKILEEPPQRALFILTTSRRTAIIPTIRSRLRVYDLPARPQPIQEEVQKRIFRISEPEATLHSFFRSYAGDANDGWGQLGADLIRALETAQQTQSIETRVKQLLSTGSPRQGAEYFLDAIGEETRRRLRGDLTSNSPIPTKVLHSWGPIVRRHWARIDRRNMNPASVLSGVILAMESSLRSRNDE